MFTCKKWPFLILVRQVADVTDLSCEVGSNDGVDWPWVKKAQLGATGDSA